MYAAHDFSHLLGTEGFSDTLLTNHFTLYEGYVNNTNKLIEELREAEPGTPEYAELHRRFGWEWNGMRLHELYFGNMKKGGSVIGEGTVYKKIVADFGSIEDWKKDFIGLGTMRGIGWVVLVHDTKQDTLFNVWVNEHDLGHLAGATPLLVMDVFEHAFMIDYGLKRADYITAFLASIDWEEVEKRIA